MAPPHGVINTARIVSTAAPKCVIDTLITLPEQNSQPHSEITLWCHKSKWQPHASKQKHSQEYKLMCTFAYLDNLQSGWVSLCWPHPSQHLGSWNSYCSMAEVCKQICEPRSMYLKPALHECGQLSMTNDQMIWLTSWAATQSTGCQWFLNLLSN